MLKSLDPRPRPRRAKSSRQAARAAHDGSGSQGAAHLIVAALEGRKVREHGRDAEEPHRIAHSEKERIRPSRSPGCRGHRHNQDYRSQSAILDPETVELAVAAHERDGNAPAQGATHHVTDLARAAP